MALVIKPDPRTVHAKIGAKYSYQVVTTDIKTAQVSGHISFDRRMPGFRGHNGIQCMINKHFPLAAHLGGGGRRRRIIPKMIPQY
jgi:hypothetical protein